MNIEPQKFFIGLMDFFSILLPSPMLTWLLMGADVLASVCNSYRRESLGGFLFSSYLFGHLVFLLGAWLDKI